MRKYINNKFWWLVFIVFTVLIIYSCKKEVPKDFAFYAEFGLARTIKVSSYNNSFTFKSSSTTDSIFVNFKFSQNELEQIWRIIDKYEISEYDSYYVPKDEYEVLPNETYFLQFEEDNIKHQITWEIYTSARDKKSKKLRLVFEKIKEIMNKNPDIARIKYNFRPL